MSKNTWIEDGESDLVDEVSLRINRITGLQTIRKYDEFNEGKKEEYEYFQVILSGVEKLGNYFIRLKNSRLLFLFTRV